MADIGGAMAAAFGGPGLQQYLQYKHQQEAEQVDFAVNNPEMLSRFPELAKIVDKHLGSPGVSQVLVEQAHNRDKAMLGQGLLGALMLLQQGKGLGSTEQGSYASGSASVSPTGQVTQGPRSSVDIPARPKTLEDFPLKPGESVKVGPKGVEYAAKGPGGGPMTPDSRLFSEYQAALQSGNTELANHLHTVLSNRAMTPAQRVQETQTAIQPFKQEEADRRTQERIAAEQRKVQNAPDQQIRGAASKYENADGSPVDPNMTWRAFGEGVRQRTIRPKQGIGQKIWDTFFGGQPSTPTSSPAVTPKPAKAAPADAEDQLRAKYNIQ